MKIQMKVAMPIAQDGKVHDLAVGDSIEVDEKTGADLIKAGVAKNLGGRPKKKAPEPPKGVTTDNVISSD